MKRPASRPASEASSPARQLYAQALHPGLGQCSRLKTCGTGTTPEAEEQMARLQVEICVEKALVVKMTKAEKVAAKVGHKVPPNTPSHYAIMLKVAPYRTQPGTNADRVEIGVAAKPAALRTPRSKWAAP
eukprot:jgi/Tetstr1/440464/TSEL_028790.t1